MNDQNKPKLKEESPKTAMGGTAVKPSAWRKLLSKKWVAPAAFVAAAAIIVTLMWIYRGTEETPTTAGNDSLEITEGTDEVALETPVDDTLEVASSNETLQWPVVNRSELTVATPFYEATASNEERQAAMVQTGNTFTPHTGLDLTSADEKPFDVVAALSGRVIVVDKHPINGNVIEIKHADGIVTVYQSLSEVQVKVNEEVKQGSLIGKSGRSEIEKEYGNHLHFEVRQNGTSINPNTLLEQ
ncbi:M23 family metallopeptidase [Paenibacillus spongiae]|uniref:M23 family metallopeptidase n=1 Tax=Paenibacillus spongiae TaxID=2909671 RepID=A0ABY5S8L1_9BACL|nr:M23 family metallopeptidase [Paenibacillus spongiae]UVI29930.1 M23 family metallopeptidase [Paenibacillus spongiae]